MLSRLLPRISISVLAVSISVPVLASAFGAASESAPQAYIHLPTRPLVFTDRFDEEVGLWVQNRSGHTASTVDLKEVRTGRIAASRLLLAAQLDALDPAQATAVLRALRGMQNKGAEEHFGCFTWYYEDDFPYDTNAAFFIGLSLIVLERTAADQLEPEGRLLLEQMLADLTVWFAREAETRKFLYPNKFMGDLVCAWLLQEDISVDSPEARNLIGIMEAAGTYWKEQNWGWGEHMSDGYSVVLLDELSALLLLSRKLPDNLRVLYQELFDELVELDDIFVGGPRVPAIRTYSGTGFSNHQGDYRGRIRPWTRRDVRRMVSGDPTFPLSDIFYRLGWHDKLAKPIAEKRQSIQVPCFDGSVANAWITDNVRLGTMSYWPVMPDIDHVSWGLSWQTLPVVLQAGKNTRGTLRWHTQEDGVDRFHPGKVRLSGHVSNTLTSGTHSTMTGVTRALQENGDALIVRTMPDVLSSWDRLSDQFVITGSDFELVEEATDGQVSRLLLRVDGSPLTLFFIALDDGVELQLKRSEKELIWEASWTPEALRGQKEVSAAWIICWDRDVSLQQMAQATMGNAGPQGEGNAWSLQWPLADGDRTVLFTPWEKNLKTGEMP